MARAVLALGANMGDPERTIKAAILQIAALPETSLLARSTLIVTPAWGKTDQPDFVNGAVLLETGLAPIVLLDAILGIEIALGRVRREKWGPRAIDIDLIAYDRVEMETQRLTLPHPYANVRDFVLGPVREIAPDVAAWLADRI